MKVLLVVILLLLLNYNSNNLILSLECYIDINSNIDYSNGECGCNNSNNQIILPPCKSISEIGDRVREYIKINKDNSLDYLKLFEKLTIIIGDGLYYLNNNNALGTLDTFNEITIQSSTRGNDSGVYIDGTNSIQNFLSSDINNFVGLSYSNSIIINNINFINFNQINNNSSNNNNNNKYILQFKSTNQEFNKISIINSTFNNINNIGIISIVNQIKNKTPIDKGNSPVFHCDYCNFTNTKFNNHNSNKQSPLQFNNLKVLFTNSNFNNNIIINSKSFINSEIGIINGANNSYYLTQFYSTTFYNNSVIYDDDHHHNQPQHHSFIYVKNSLLYFNYNQLFNNSGTIISFNGDQDQLDASQQSNNIYLFFDHNLFSGNKINTHHHNNNHHHNFGIINLFKSNYDYINYRSVISNSIFQNNNINNNNYNNNSSSSHINNNINNNHNQYIIVSTCFAIEFNNITIDNPIISSSILQNEYRFILSNNSFIIISNSYILSNTLISGSLSNIQIKASKISLDLQSLHQCLNCHFNIEVLDSLGLALESYDFDTYGGSGNNNIHSGTQIKSNIDHYKLYLKIIVSVILITITSALIYLIFFLKIQT